MESVMHFFREEPIVPFAVLLAVILIVPPIFERIRLPGLVGLLAAGVILGPNGLSLLQEKSDIMKLLSDIGLVYLMFVAGLEVDMEQFTRTKHRSIGFGSATFLVPLITGIAIGRLFGFDWNASFLIGSLLASHTLLAYPIVSRLGVVNNEAVTVTIGATIFTDIGALLVLAICVGIHAGDFSPTKLLILVGSLAIYTVLILFGFNWVGREFFRRSGDEQGNQFLFILLAVFLAAVGAQVIGVEKIVGAFLAGLAVNGVISHGPVKEKVVFIGTVLFIPFFFVNMGLLINIPTFFRSLTDLNSLGLTLAIVGGLIGSKLGAAAIARWLYKYSSREMIVMWSLSLPQVAATLAATVVGYRAGILTEGVLNSVIVLMLVTSTLGPVLTARFAIDLPATSRPPSDVDTNELNELTWQSSLEHPYIVVVPVYNPRTERDLLELATIMARYHGGQIVPLSIAVARTQMDDPQLGHTLERSQSLMETAAQYSREVGVAAEPLVRIDDSIAQGISRASREQHASLIVMGWGRRSGFQARLLGNVIDQVLWASNCPVMMSRLLDSPRTFHRILVPIENVVQPVSWLLHIVQALAAENQAEVTLLHVCDRTTSTQRVDWLYHQITMLAERLALPSLPKVKITLSEDIARVVSNDSKDYDLVVLRLFPRPSSAGGMAVSDLTTRMVQQLTCSVIMVGMRS